MGEIVGPLYGEAMTMILGYAPTEKQLSDPTQRIHKVLETARILYGLIHARYVLTAQGLTDMKAKYKAHEFGSCPRTLCEKQTVLPTGVADTASLSGASTCRAFSVSRSTRLKSNKYLSPSGTNGPSDSRTSPSPTGTRRKHSMCACASRLVAEVCRRPLQVPLSLS